MSVKQLSDGKFAVLIPGEPIYLYDTEGAAETADKMKRSLAGFLNLPITGERLGKWIAYRDKALAEYEESNPR